MWTVKVQSVMSHDMPFITDRTTSGTARASRHFNSTKCLYWGHGQRCYCATVLLCCCPHLRYHQTHVSHPTWLPSCYHYHHCLRHAAGGTIGWDNALQAVRSRFRFQMVSLEFFVDIILPVALLPWGYSASNRNEYQEYLLGGKGGRCVGLTLPPSCADCLEIWEPQPLGTLRVCPGL